MPTGCFYIPEEFQETWRRFLSIARREGRTAGEVLRELVSRYVEAHDPGNPQARITSYLEGGPAETASIEGRIRERFRLLPDCRFTDIVRACRGSVKSPQEGLAMAQRVAAWLRERGVRVWR